MSYAGHAKEHGSRSIRPMDKNDLSRATSHVQTAAGQSKPFRRKTGVHQRSVLSPLLFVTVMDAVTKGLSDSLHGLACMQTMWC
ncbi:unnamed protein product [Strongylus vulgaris]|uniref:Reverse transcriptase domain-containing protein n=1 Tax=Strongylus vulgaris TaxID=40348 RepID=A0A3P7KCP2_STRVU|nr:unnamed protein product [Strongylus vulgaris]